MAYHVMPSPSDHIRAADTVERLLERAGLGEHHAVLVVAALFGTATVRILEVDRFEGDRIRASFEDTIDFTDLLAAAMTGAHSAGMVLRTIREGETDKVYAWRFNSGVPVPLGETEAETAYKTDPVTGEPIPAQGNVEYMEAFSLLR
ncbi:hypothetical protein [Streptomyces sp. NBC_00691]|uniref:hypothetical protein n=1 Tax=Streptomyces sp. NBC_00691 TaxID=2903671 RepID=UPI002E30DF5D|nr:hypothetical protein [Streptomyces sp. NBC_00691]